MRNTILKLVVSYPTTFIKKIASDPALVDWITSNTLLQSSHFPSVVYSAVFQQTNVCEYGNIKHYDRWSTGFKNCGPASICKCTRERISNTVSKTKQQWSSEQKQATNAKRKETMLQKYNAETNLQRTNIRHKLTTTKLPNTTFEKLNNKEWLYTEYITKKKTAVEIASELNVYYGTVLHYCRKHKFKIRQHSNYSITEKEVVCFIESLGVQVETNNRSILGKQEIDIFISSKSLGIEINGLYWHSSKPPEFHVNKTITCNSKGIQLLHITDYDWNHNRSIIQSIIKNKLGKNTRIFARHCKVNIVEQGVAVKFCNENYLYPPPADCMWYGLFFNEELVQLISISDNALLVICSKKNTTVVGGLSKLLSKIPSTPIFAKCNRELFTGSSLNKVGFSFIGVTQVSHIWTDGTTKSEKQETEKFKRFWDCGYNIFSKINKRKSDQC